MTLKLYRVSCAMWGALSIVSAVGCDEGTAQSADPSLNQLPPDSGAEISALVRYEAGTDNEAADAEASTDAGTAHASQDAQLGDAACAPTADAGRVADGTFASVFTLLKKDCASCHTAGKAPTISTIEDTYAELVGAPAKRACAADGGMHVLVVPGAPDDSLLMQKLLGHQTCGRQMPVVALLPADEVEVYRAWIAAGAPRD